MSLISLPRSLIVNLNSYCQLPLLCRSLNLDFTEKTIVVKFWLRTHFKYPGTLDPTDIKFLWVLMRYDVNLYKTIITNNHIYWMSGCPEKKLLSKITSAVQNGFSFLFLINQILSDGVNAGTEALFCHSVLRSKNISLLKYYFEDFDIKDSLGKTNIPEDIIKIFLADKSYFITTMEILKLNNLNCSAHLITTYLKGETDFEIVKCLSTYFGESFDIENCYLLWLKYPELLDQLYQNIAQVNLNIDDFEYLEISDSSLEFLSKYKNKYDNDQLNNLVIEKLEDLDDPAMLSKFLNIMSPNLAELRFPKYEEVVCTLSPQNFRVLITYAIEKKEDDILLNNMKLNGFPKLRIKIEDLEQLITLTKEYPQFFNETVTVSL